MRVQWKCVLFLAANALVWGQGPPPVQHYGGPGQERSRQSPGGKWWENPEMVKQLGLTADQQKKMDEAWQQNRLKLIDLSATLEKEEVMMESLLKGPQLDDAKILPAIDRIAQARAELEKVNARLMLAIRHVLTPEQWEKMNERGPETHSGRPGGPMPPGPPPPASHPHSPGAGPGPGGPPQE